LNFVSSATYDRVGNMATSVNQRAQTTTYGYDPMNRVASVTAPQVGTTSYAYTTMGFLKTRTNPLLKVTTYDYDVFGKKIKETDPLGRFFTYTYDVAYNLSTIVDANANAAANPALGTTTLAYDKLHRLTGKTYSDGTPAVTYTYDTQDRRATMVDGTGTTTYGYDTANRVATVTRGTDVFSYLYDNNSNVTSRTYPGQAAITATFDDANQMTSVVDPGGTSRTAPLRPLPMTTGHG
jgi:YD repeat-containing protein